MGLHQFRLGGQLLRGVGIDPQIGKDQKQISQGKESCVHAPRLMSHHILNFHFDQHPNGLDQQIEQNDEADICKKCFDDAKIVPDCEIISYLGEKIKQA